MRNRSRRTTREEDRGGGEPQQKMKAIQGAEAVVFEANQLFSTLARPEGLKSISVDKVTALSNKLTKKLNQENMDWYFFECADSDTSNGMAVCQALNSALEKCSAAKSVVSALPAMTRGGENLTAATLEAALLEATRCNLELPEYARITLVTRATSEYASNGEYDCVSLALSALVEFELRSTIIGGIWTLAPGSQPQQQKAIFMKTVNFVMRLKSDW